jgi:hypothetical protein
MIPRRQIAVVAAVLALVAAYDFFGRIFVGRDATLRTVNAPQMTPLPQRPDAEAIRKQLAAWLPALPGSLGPEAANSDPASWQFTLVGVFRQDGRQFALVNAQQQGGGAVETVQVREGDDLRGATVKHISSTRVTLQRGEKPEELLMFGPPQTVHQPRDTPREPAARRGGALEGLVPSDPRLAERLKASAGNVVKPAGSSPAATAARPSATAPKPARTAPKNAAQSKVVESQELRPGEEVKLPWNLPVVEGDGAKAEQKR